MIESHAVLEGSKGEAGVRLRRGAHRGPVKSTQRLGLGNLLTAKSNLATCWGSGQPKSAPGASPTPKTASMAATSDW